MARCLYILYIPVTHLRRTTTIDYPQQAKPKPNPSLLSTVLYLALSEKAVLQAGPPPDQCPAPQRRRPAPAVVVAAVVARPGRSVACGRGQV